MTNGPRLAITLGDVAGIGPELVAKSWGRDDFHSLGRPVVIGSVAVMTRVLREEQTGVMVRPVKSGELTESWPESTRTLMPVYEPAGVDVSSVPAGQVSAAAGRAAHDYLIAATDLAMAQSCDALVTLPLNKEGLHAAGLPYPGHTEILGERTGTRDFGMMLYRRGLGVLHVTLHQALRDVASTLTQERIESTIRLLHDMMGRLQHAPPRLAAAAFNPHASDGGLFGDEEEKLIKPAVAAMRASGINVVGPIPADTLFGRAVAGEFDGIAAMYHDQGHIALKLLGWREAVNITVGLPIVRTSVAHGTGYDIVGQHKADPTSLLEAMSVAARLAQNT